MDGGALIWTCGPQPTRITTTKPPLPPRTGRRRWRDDASGEGQVRSRRVASPPARAAELVDETLPRGGATVNCHSIAGAALKACMVVNEKTSKANVKQDEWVG